MTDANVTQLEDPEFHEILTERLRLRTVRVSDAEALMPLISRFDVMKWTSQGPVSNIDQAKRWLSVRSQGKDVFNFAIELRNPSPSDSTNIKLIGLAGCFHLPEVGYMIHPDFAGKGYATEALNAIIAPLFSHIPHASESNERGTLGYDYIEGWTDAQNHASQKILKKAGFTYCETLPDPENQLRGPSELLIWRKARPGMVLEELSIAPVVKEEEFGAPRAPTPPVQ